MSNKTLDYLIIGPAYPYRGGISDTQHELAKALQEQGKTVKLITFTTLYPEFLFPGSSPLSLAKFFKYSKLLIKEHNTYLEKYIYSLVLEGKVHQAANEIKQNSTENNSKFFDFVN